MNLPAFWHESWTAALVNHLWQSTVVVAIAWLLALALRKNQARARYWVWMAASVKFLVPFSLFIAAGEWARSLIAAPLVAQPALAAVMEQVAQPFPQTQFFDAALPASAPQHAKLLPAILLAIWACGMLIVLFRWARGWRQIRAAVRKAAPTELAACVPALSTTAPIEPGIFGIFRPVLLLPEGILNRLTRAQLDAIVAHEMCHVRRRDNLTFALHMIVEALFWFHPAVWWIGARLIEERERACDENVVQAGGGAESYAEGILNVSKFCVESPLACTAGVTGADLKKRIVRIMADHAAHRLDLSRKLLLGAAGVLAVTAPLALGLAQAKQGYTQPDDAAVNLPRFDAVTIKPYTASDMMVGVRMAQDELSVTGMPLYMLVRQVFALPGDRVVNEPDWVRSDRYDIEAKVDAAAVPQVEKLAERERWEMMLPVLEDRFGLKFHYEMRVVPVFTLAVAKGGPKLAPFEASDHGAMSMFKRDTAHRSTEGMTIEGRGDSLAMIARMISGQLGSTVVDRTSLKGRYNYTLTYVPETGFRGSMGLPPGGSDADGGVPPTASAGPSLLTAVREQLGLKLEERKEPMRVVVIDHIEHPSPN